MHDDVLCADRLNFCSRFDGADWILSNKSKTGLIDKSNMEPAWRRIRKNAGLEDMGMHNLCLTARTVDGAAGAIALKCAIYWDTKTLP